jgi:hypothetical protein
MYLPTQYLPEQLICQAAQPGMFGATATVEGLARIELAETAASEASDDNKSGNSADAD